jgi:uncharacterized membrane protein
MPAYFSILWAVNSVFSPGYGMRLVSVAFGILSVAALYFLGKEIFSKRAGMASSFVMAFSPFHIAYSQYLREYSMLIFLFIVSLLFFWRAVRQNKKFDWAALSVSNAMMFLTHFLSGVFIASQFLSLFLLKSGKRQSIKTFLAYSAPAAAVSAPWIFFLASRAVIGNYGGSFDYNPLRMAYVIYKLSIGVNVSGFLEWFPPLLPAVLAFFAVLLALTFRFLYRKGGFINLLVANLFIPIALLYIISSAFLNVFSYRYLSPLLGVYVLLVSAAMAGIKKGNFRILLFAALAILYLASDFYYFSVITLPDWPARFGI